MGQILIETRGSFGKSVLSVSAMPHGHADAVAQAIEWLSGKVLPKATELDHQLHTEGQEPENGWARTAKEGSRD
jgi:hypothetical protein